MKKANRYIRAVMIASVAQCCTTMIALAGDVTGAPINTFTTTGNAKDIVLNGTTPTFSPDLTTYNSFINNVHSVIGYAGPNQGDSGQVGLADLQHQTGPIDTVFGDAPAPYAMVGRYANGDLSTFVYKFTLGLGFVTGPGASINADVYFRGTLTSDGGAEFIGVNNTFVPSGNLVEISNSSEFQKLTMHNLFGNTGGFATYRNTNASLAIPSGLSEFYVAVSDEGGSGRLAIGSMTVNSAAVGTGDPTWVLNGSGDWNINANWASGVPNSVGAKAVFGSTITSPRTVFTDTAITVGSIKFDNANGYQITGQGSLTVDAGGSSGSIQVLQGNHKINLPTLVASNTAIAVANGATLTIADPITIAQNKTVTKNGTVFITAPLTLEAGASLVSGGGALALFGAPSLGTNAKVDVTIGSALVDYRGQSTPASIIKSQLASAFAGGAWTGGGITSSSTIAGQTGVGWKEDAASQSITVKYTYYGDLNLDGAVSTGDFTVFATNFNGTSKVWAQGDFNYDGVINALDFNALASNFGSALPGPALGAVVPEPASLALFALGCTGLIRRSRRWRAA